MRFDLLVSTRSAWRRTVAEGWMLMQRLEEGVRVSMDGA